MSDKLKRDFYAQRANAKRRGIEFELTFDQWVEWWGDDIGNRGIKAWNLQMQRPHDAGPYALWNIIKGTPKRNGRTRGLRVATAEAVRARDEVEARLDRAMWEDSREADEPEDDSIGAAYARDAGMDTSDNRIGRFVKNKGMA